MALKVTIGDEGQLFAGEDKLIDTEVLDANESPVDVTGFGFQFRVKKAVTDADADALIDVAASVVGTFDAVRAANTQRVRVTLTDTHMAESVFTFEDRYRSKNSHSLKRTDDGSETIIIYGPFIVERTTQV